MSKESKGIFWSAIDHFSVQGIQFILSIIIARLVAPSAYGVIVMVQVFLSFAQLFVDCGFKDALIQKTARKDIDYYTVFNFNLIVSVILYGVMYFVSPIIADFYDEPILINLTRVISLSLIFSSLSLTQLVRLSVNLDFKTLAKARTFAAIISGVIGIFCAYNGMEVWALVIQNLVASLLTSFFLMIVSRWMPKFVFSLDSFKQLFSFGSKLLFTNFVTLSYMQLTNLLVGKVYSSASLAYYNRGFNTSLIIPSSIMNVMDRVSYPLFCEKHHDLTQLRMIYRKYMRLKVLAIIPLMAVMAVLSKQIVVILLTERWIEASPFLSVFCIVYMTQPILVTAGQLILAVGRADLAAKFTVVKRIITFGLLLITINISPLAIALGLIINNYFECGIAFYCTKKAIGFTYLEQLSDIINIVMLSIVVALVTFICSQISTNIYLSVCFGIIGGLISFVIGLTKIEEKALFVNIINNSFNRVKTR